MKLLNDLVNNKKIDIENDTYNLHCFDFYTDKNQNDWLNKYANIIKE